MGAASSAHATLLIFEFLSTVLTGPSNAGSGSVDRAGMPIVTSGVTVTDVDLTPNSGVRALQAMTTFNFRGLGSWL